MSIDLKTTTGENVRNYGNTDTGTMPHTFFYHPDGNTPGAQEEFEAVIQTLSDLAHSRDGNGDVIAEFVALRRSPRIHFVAFRFTSDWAYRHYYSGVQQTGPGLGRGTYRPFKRPEDFDFYLGN